MSQYPWRLRVAFVSLVVTLGVIVPFTDAGGWRRPARRNCGIPIDVNYQTNEPRHRATVASSEADPPNAADTLSVARKVFRPLREPLTVNDCALTQIRFIVAANGAYQFGFRAANTAPSLDRVTPTLPGEVRPQPASNAGAVPIMPVRHHRFQVTVRLYSGSEDSAQSDPRRADGIMLATLTFDPFYVAAEGELVDSKAGNYWGFQANFAAATRAEFELEIDPPLTLPTPTKRP